MFTDGYPWSSWGNPDYCDTLFVIHGDPQKRIHANLEQLYIMNNKSVKILDNSGSLSETDPQLISGTDLLLSLMRNPRLVMVTNGGTELDWQKLMQGVTGLYH